MGVSLSLVYGFRRHASLERCGVTGLAPLSCDLS
jgi:hypothetical protein